MDSLLSLLLTNAALAGLLALAAWAASRFIRRQAVVHALWLLALVKLVTPPLVALPLLPARSAGETASASTPALEGRLPERAHTPLAERLARRTGTAASRPATDPLPAPAALAGLAASARRLAIPVLLVLGALCVGGLTALRFARFRRLVSSSEPARRELDERAAELAASLGIRHPPPVRLVAARIPPVLWPSSAGPLLLLPRDLLPELTGDELDALLAHELAHVLRRDHWVRFLEIAATALFWWYPVTWWARRALRRAEERCCDEWVLRALPASARAYANGILKSLTFVADAPVPLPAAASGAGPIDDLEARLKEILMTNPLPRLSRPIRLALGATALAGLALFPTVAPPGAQAAAMATLPATDETPQPNTVPAPSSAPVVAPAPFAAQAVTPRASNLARIAAIAAVLPGSAHLSGGTPLPMLARLHEEGDPALDAERRALEGQRRQLQRSQLDLERRSLDLEARVQQKELAGEATRRRAEGDVDGAARIEKQASLDARRVDLEQRRLDLQVKQLGLEAELEKASLEDETGGSAGASGEKRRDAKKALQELEEKGRALESEVEKLDGQMQALESEARILELRGSTDELAKSLAEQIASHREVLPEAGAQKADLEREIERLEAAIGALEGGATKARTRTRTRQPAPPAEK